MSEEVGDSWNGQQMPIENIVSTPELTTLTDVEISSVKGLTCVPEQLLKKNQNLTSLSIRLCDDLTCIAPNVFGCCTSLQSLSITDCKKGMESLREVEIRDCGGLSIPPSGLQFCTSLQLLTVSDCPLLTSIPITQGMPSLRELEIACAGLSSLPTGLRFCTSLEILRIRGGCFSTLPSISFTRVLRELRIMDCSELTSISMSLHCLTSLKALRIGGLWEELDSFPDFQLPPNSQLYGLRLDGWPKLKCLPQIHHLTCLGLLKIYNFGGLESLPEWLGNLESLVDLYLEDCENLKYLPTLEAMRRLTNLKLYMKGCPLLEERCITNGPNGPRFPTSWLPIMAVVPQYRSAWEPQEDDSGEKNRLGAEEFVLGLCD
ncbi:hypothetical protein M0R45_020340 [Rubus argutus]|uniref:R13L1/DRL21-like LRR repeat region domain-containing protein n=1 Tax=Rubus argutus TaxID=59490 RepID=A0AAW1X904_RUBAR